MDEPKIILETRRLLLREMTLNDFDALKAVITDPETMKYYTHQYSDYDVVRWIDWCIDSYKRYGFGLYAVIYKETNEMIGDCGVSMQTIDKVLRPEIGYHLNKKYHSQVIGKEMTRAMKNYFFNNFKFDEVYSYMNEENVPSYKTAERNGMKYIKTYEDDGEKLKVYKITRKEWEQGFSTIDNDSKSQF